MIVFLLACILVVLVCILLALIPAPRYYPAPVPGARTRLQLWEAESKEREEARAEDARYFLREPH
jgi:hypothetical protein